MLLPILADVIAKLLFSICRLMLLSMYCCWLMLLPWQMLLPIFVEDVKPQAFNFCNKCVADVIARWQMEWPCRVTWQMLFAMGQIYFNSSSEVLSRTSSHM